MCNYRPISVIGHIAKIYEKCVQSQLLNYLVEHNFISNHQSAFIKYHSTQTLLHKVVDNWLENIDNGLITGVCFFDVAKCFDSISHELLLFKLEKYGVKSKELNLFKSYLSERLQSTFCHNVLSPFTTVRSGIPQGSILGPLLFVLFMSDLPMDIFEIFKYADDTMIDCYADTVHNINRMLQTDIDKVSSWFRHNKLKLNIDKSSVMYVGSKQKFNNSDFSDIGNLNIDNTDILVDETYRYLGLIVDSNLTWNEHIEMLSKKLSTRIAVLYRLGQILPYHCLGNIYYALMQSTIDYGLTIWGHTSNSNILRIQRFQNRAARICTQCFDYNVSSFCLINELGWLTVTERMEYLTGILMYKCMTGLAPNYLSDLFTETIYVHDINTRNVADNNLYIPRARTNAYKKSLSVYGAGLWNNIPNEIKLSPNIACFKYEYKCFIKSKRTLQ
jgi:hypothetical protein